MDQNLPILLSQGSSSSSTKRRRRGRDQILQEVINIRSIEPALRQICPCAHKPGGQSCLRYFSAPDLWGLRQARWSLSNNQDQAVRFAELKQAIEVDLQCPRALVKGKLVCVPAYCLVYAYTRTSIARSLRKVRQGMEAVPAGRPKGSSNSDPLGTSARNLACYAWLKEWVSYVGDDDPVGKSSKKVVNFVTVGELHEEYCRNYNAFNHLRSDTPLSLRRFGEIWKYFKTKEQIRVRRKANTTTKCRACDELHQRASAAHVTRQELQEIAVARAHHRDEIRELRMLYMDDIQKAHSHYNFQTIVFDGTNSNTCRCPENWRAYIRDEQGNNTYVQQKIQSILIHGVALIFYVVTPCVSLGMNLTISSLLDALQYVDPRTEVVRFQYDGERVLGAFRFFPWRPCRDFLGLQFGFQGAPKT